MSIEKTMTPRDLKLVAPKNLTPEQKAQLGRRVWSENKAFEEANLQGKDLVRWKYQRYMKDYLRCIASVDDNVGRVLDYLDETGLAENTIVIYTSRPGLLPGRSRLVRQAVHVRGIAADAAAGPLARRRSSRAR